MFLGIKCVGVEEAKHLAGDNGLHKEAEHGEHGQAPVLDLLHLQLCQSVLRKLSSLSAFFQECFIAIRRLPAPLAEGNTTTAIEIKSRPH